MILKGLLIKPKRSPFLAKFGYLYPNSRGNKAALPPIFETDDVVDVGSEMPHYLHTVLCSQGLKGKILAWRKRIGARVLSGSTE